MGKVSAKQGQIAAGLPFDSLRPECDPTKLGFQSTSGLKSVAHLIGQDRAIDAINLSASIIDRGFNIYVLGRAGTGRHKIVDDLVTKQAADRPTSPDWVYVNNFDAPHKPNAVINESQGAFLEDLMTTRGYLKADQMAGAFQLLRSNDLMWSHVIRHYLLGERTHDNPLLAWNADATRMPARMHSGYLRRLFLKTIWPRGGSRWMSHLLP